MADIIQIRRDSASDWTSANPTLASGELGYETDTGKLKFGDGTTAWTSLAYYTTTPTETVQDIVGAMFTGNTETRVSATYEDGDGTIDLVVDDMTTDTNTNQLTTFNIGVDTNTNATTIAHGETLTIAGVTNCATETTADGTVTITATDTNTQLSTEAVQDIVGGMVTGNTETNIAVTYEDGDGTLDFVATDTNTTYSVSAVDSGDDAIIRLTDSGAGTDDVKLVAGTNVQITPTGDNITIGSRTEGTGIESTGVDVDNYLRADGDNTCSWQKLYPEGTNVKSTGEGGGTKFLREDGDGTSSWQTVSAGSIEGTGVLSTGEGGGTKFLREDGDGTCSWQTPAGGGGGTARWEISFGGYGNASNNTSYYMNSHPKYYYWSNVDFAYPSNISYSNMYKAQWIAPADGTLTRLITSIKSNRADNVKFYVHKFSPIYGSDGNGNTALTEIAVSDEMAITTTNETYVYSKTISSSNTISSGDFVIVTLKKEVSTGTSSQYIHVHLSGEYD